MGRRVPLVLAGLLAIIAIWINVVAGVDPVVGPFPRATVPTSSFPLAGPDGSCAAPTYSFSSETGTGITRSASSQLDIALGGACYFRLTTTALLPVTDNTIALGSTALRLTTVNAVTSYNLYAAASDTQPLAVLDNTPRLAFGVGGSTAPDSIIGRTATRQFAISGTYAGTNPTTAFGIDSTLQVPANANANGFRIGPIITPASSGTHATLQGGSITPSFTAGTAATVTDAVGLTIGTFVAPANTTNASGVKIVNPPTAGTNNYGLWVAGTGAVRLDASVGVGGVTTPSTTAGGLTLAATAFASLPADANGTFRYCSDCDPPIAVDATCASAGTKTGSLAFRVNGAWKCIS